MPKVVDIIADIENYPAFRKLSATESARQILDPMPLGSFFLGQDLDGHYFAAMRTSKRTLIFPLEITEAGLQFLNGPTQFETFTLFLEHFKKKLDAMIESHASPTLSSSSSSVDKPSLEDAALEVKKLLPSLTESHDIGKFRTRMEDASAMHLINMQNVTTADLPRLMQVVVNQLQKNVDALDIDKSDGTTFLTAIIKDNRLTIAYLGDSECGLLKRQDEGHYAFQRFIKREQMHTLHSDAERSKALLAGATFARNRILSQEKFGLSVTRSIHSKQCARSFYSHTPKFMHQIDCLPSINLENLNPDDYLMLSCDGVTEPDTMLDARSNATSSLNVAIARLMQHQPISSALIMQAAFDKGSQDNISVICVRIGDLQKACQDDPDLAIVLNINDGHGGPEAANYCARELKNVLTTYVQQIQANKNLSSVSSSSNSGSLQNSQTTENIEPVQDSPSPK